MRSLSSLLEKIIVSSVDVDSFPKSVVEVYIMALEVDGGECWAASLIRRPSVSCDDVRVAGSDGRGNSSVWHARLLLRGSCRFLPSF